MYPEETLFIASMVATTLFFLLITYMIASSKTTRLLREIVKRETEPFDALSVTMQSTQPIQGAGDIVTFVPAELTDESIHSMGTLLNDKESIGFQPESSGVYSVELKPIEDIDSSALDGQYTLLGELESGGMGRVFLARKNNVGNDWIIKYVPRHIGKLTKEADILKSLNHPSLPQVIDIFVSTDGLFIVQSHIPGISMQSVIDALKTESVAGISVIPEFKLLDWACQLTEVLVYLHTRDQPVFHFDLKPSNLMVSLGNKLSLIDFGISKRQSDDPVIEAVTFEYAAPEQLKKLPQLEYVETIMLRRFGGINGLPESRKEWLMDERTDIYSLGVVLFETAVGEIPTIKNRGLLRRLLSKGLCDIIEKCLELDPSDRYQSSSELLKSLHLQASIGKQKIHATLWKRKLAKALSVILMAVATMTLATGLLTRAVEATAIMYLNPELITVSVLQSTEVTITRELPESQNAFLRFLTNSGETQLLDPNQLNWETEANHIAQVDGNRILGLNVGETTIYAQHREQRIAIQVKVVEPMEDIVDISMRYQPGHFMRLFAGSNHNEIVDGDVAEAEFAFPESMDTAYNGSVYFIDTYSLRRLHNGVIETINIDPAYIQAHMVRIFHNDVYILTNSWQDEDNEHFYGIMRYANDEFVMFYVANALLTEIRDFIVTEETIYFVERNRGVEATYLRSINRQNTSDIQTLLELPSGTSAITHDADRIYFADKSNGTLFYYKQGQRTHLAGIPDERAFIDGTAPLFYQPIRIQYYDNAIYIWDFNTIRKVFLEDGTVREAISLAGVASPDFPMYFEMQMPAEDIVLPHSRRADFVIFEQGILLTDPTRGVIWKFE